MKGFTGRYLAEIVSLTVMALMAIALIAGEADATLHGSVRSEADFAVHAPAAPQERIVEATASGAGLTIRLDFEAVGELVHDQRLIDALHEVIDIDLHRGR